MGHGKGLRLEDLSSTCWSFSVLMFVIVEMSFFFSRCMIIPCCCGGCCSGCCRRRCCCRTAIRGSGGEEGLV